MPWLWSVSVTALKSRPGNRFSMRVRKSASIARMSVKVPCLGQVFSTITLAVTLDDLRLDLADVLVDQRLDRLLAGEDAGPRLLDAGRAQRIGRAGPAELGLRPLVALHERSRRPLGLERIGLDPTVDGLKHGPGETRGAGEHRFDGTPDVDGHRIVILALQAGCPGESRRNRLNSRTISEQNYTMSPAAPGPPATSSSKARRLTLPRSSRGNSGTKMRRRGIL